MLTTSLAPTAQEWLSLLKLLAEELGPILFRRGSDIVHMSPELLRKKILLGSVVPESLIDDSTVGDIVVPVSYQIELEFYSTHSHSWNISVVFYGPHGNGSQIQ